MLDGSELFGTDDKTEVKDVRCRGYLCRGTAIPLLALRNQVPFSCNPITKRFQSGLIIFRSFTGRPRRVVLPLPHRATFVRLDHYFFVTTFCVIKYALLGHEMSLHATL
jgi:hypothetical protein